MIDVTTVRTQLIILNVTADAHNCGALEDDPPCSRCGTSCPAVEPDECDDARCPLEGRP